jgi:drug/metabolite transporter (DMT)-like permease
MEYALGLVAAALLGTSFVLQQGAAQRVPAADFLRLRLVADLLRQPRWLAGIGTMICGQLLSGWVIGHIILAVSEPLLATNLPVALSLAWPLSGQRLKASEITGAFVLLAGVIALAVAQSVASDQDTIGSPRYWPYCGAIVAVLAAGLALAGRRRPGPVRAALAGTGAGLAFGVQDALTRRTVDALGGLHQIAALLASWPVYSLVAASVAGLWLMQNAFSAAPLHASLPARHHRRRAGVRHGARHRRVPGEGPGLTRDDRAAGGRAGRPGRRGGDGGARTRAGRRPGGPPSPAPGRRRRGHPAAGGRS